jgi:hypothetical protein
MAVFYGQVMNESFKKQMKENRKVEELILMFATHATGVLKKEPSLAGEGWKLELNNQISQFVKMLRDCLKGLSHVSPELLARLDMYSAKLAPQTYSDSGYDSASTTRDRDTVMSPTVGGGTSVADMELVRTVAQLFKVPESAVHKEVEKMKKFCTEKVGAFSYPSIFVLTILHPGCLDGSQSECANVLVLTPILISPI